MGIEWGDVGGLTGGIAGVVGAVTGLIGMSRAKRANEFAKRGNDLAVGANQLAQDANKLAEHANDKSAESNEIAREANGIALRANELAVDANTFAHRQDRRSTESHDVRWDGEWVAPGRYALATNGEHVAYDVIAVVTVDAEEKRVTSPRVEPGEPLTLDFPEARRKFEAEQREYADVQARQRTSAPWGVSTSDTLRFYTHTIEKRVQWKTELDAPKVQEEPRGFTALGNFD